MRHNLREQVLREFGDEGADTLDRYFAQMEYTAFWCIQMLMPGEGVVAVIPEGVEDLVIERGGHRELRQIKTRDEGRGAWTTAEVLPHLCAQYNRRHAFDSTCSFHFVSDAQADTRTGFVRGSYGPLYRLKDLLELKRLSHTFAADDEVALNFFRERLVPRIREVLCNAHGDEVDDDGAWDLLCRSHIETNSIGLRSPSNPRDLDTALDAHLSDGERYSVSQLDAIYDRLLLLIIRKIRHQGTIEGRRIRAPDVVGCRVAPNPIVDGPDWDSLAGTTMLEKKARLGRFDPTEIRLFQRQRSMGQELLRRLRSLGLEEPLEQLSAEMLALQHRIRRSVSRDVRLVGEPGPAMYSELQGQLLPIAQRLLPSVSDLDETRCLGLLWSETDQCFARWDTISNETS